MSLIDKITNFTTHCSPISELPSIDHHDITTLLFLFAANSQKLRI